LTVLAINFYTSIEFFRKLLVEKPIRIKPEVRKLIIAAISRLIITKEPKASLARDTAHSRPHKVILYQNNIGFRCKEIRIFERAENFPS